tara:strand:- start:108 stop:404 length:297 start_codon:yes stop_codon:yes gene_type:complete
LIKTLSKFVILIIFIFIFLYFKNYTKITKNELQNLKNDYEKNFQIYLKREVQLSKMLNQFEYESLDENLVFNEKIIKFDRGIDSDFTLIMVGYDKPQQ